ncbi:ABC-type organic anion transporter ABCA8-like [Artemia franciscana]
MEENSKRIIHDPSFWCQLKATIRRNILLKIRDKRKTIAEFLLPIYFLAILIIVKLAIPNPTYPEVTEERGYPAWTMNSILTRPGPPLFYTPNTTEATQFIKQIIETWFIYTESLSNSIEEKLLFPPIFIPIESEEALSDLYNSESSGNFTLALVIEKNITVAKQYRIKNSLETSGLPNSNSLTLSERECRNPYIGDPLDFPLDYTCLPNNYYYSRIMGLQSLVDFTLTRLETPNAWLDHIPKVQMAGFPRPAYTDEASLYPLRAIIPLYMTLVLSQFITYLLTLVVGEKEKKIKEGMKMMGLRDSVFWLSWFLIYFLLVLFLATVSTLVLFSIGVFQNTDYGLLFLLFILYGLSVISLGFVITAFFDKARVAGIFGALVVSFLNMLYYIQVFASGSDVAIFWGLSLISPTAFALSMDKALLLDIQGVGLSWSTIWNGPDMPFAGGLIMVSVDIVLYAFLAFYLDNVLPSEFGAKQKPWFILTPSFWAGKAKKIKSFELNSEDENDANIEAVSRESIGKEVIRIQGITKSFKAWGKLSVSAVRGITLNCYEGHITAILGHNGAGKTTLINMLTGVTSPSEGTAYIEGMDIRDPSSMKEIRKSFGVCPQHDILLDNLTPKEHLEFFARIRGVPEHEVEQMVSETLKDVDLTSKTNCKTGQLSGGQKRKLSIGIALIGDPKIIFLDEPSAGVDPYSRRHLWELLKKRKEGKCIILTTHFMDEADILADRKAIVSHGKVRCCGSSLFLKNKFGVGYHLTFVASENCNVDAVTSVVQTHVPTAFLKRRHGKELSYILPRDQCSQFADLFEDIENKMKNPNFQVSSCGISMTTLEEVFLKLGEEEEEAWQELQRKEVNGVDNKAFEETSQDNNSESKLYPKFSSDELRVKIKKSTSRSLKAMLKIRFLSLLREPQAVYFMLIAPILFTALGMFLGTLDITQEQQKGRTFNSSTYAGNTLLFNIEGASESQIQFWNEFQQYIDLDTREFSGNFEELLQELPAMAFVNFSSFEFATLTDLTYGIMMNVNPVYSHLPGAMTNVFNNVARRISWKNATGEYPPDEIQEILNPMPYKVLPVQFNPGQFSSAIFIGMVFILTPTSLNIDLVQDRETRAKNQLRVNGLSFGIYFGSYFIVLGVMILFTYGCLLGLIQIFNIVSLTSPAAFATTALIYLLYCPTTLLFGACASYFFDKVETAQAVFPNVGIFLGFIPYIVISLLDMLQVGGDNSIALILHYVFTFIDTLYIPFGSIYFVQKVYIGCTVGTLYGSGVDCNNLSFTDYISKPEIYVCILACLIMIPVLIVVLMILDVKKSGGLAGDAFLWLKVFFPGKENGKSVSDCEEVDTNNEDSDVKIERQRVDRKLEDDDSDAVILIQGLRKEYSKPEENAKKKKGKRGKKFVAVRDITLAVEKGEVFGLLGHNGAGKTTTMRVIIAEEAPTKGKVIIDNKNIKSSLSVAFQALGYCPQFDAQWKNITVAEHLEAYCDIRGVQKDDSTRIVQVFLDGLQINEHKNKWSKNCSGGTKRKLSYAMSMIGQPKIVLLDEPSTGMDPQSKRFLWNTISNSFASDKGAILTTHSMEEADALCSRIAIMVKGELRCIGSSQHLKNRYGSGYELEVKLGAIQNDFQHEECTKDLIEFIKNLFPNSKLEEKFDNRVIYSVPQTDIKSLARAFRAIESRRDNLHIEEYSFSQTTLEQVFLRFAKLQESPYEDDD